MPSSTFFHLPEEKRRKLLDCARAEFVRVPYPDVSINQIIRAAGIPRGSFYMYFTDKEELFHYLLSLFEERVEALMIQLLDQTGGDLLAAFLGCFDTILADCKNPGHRPEYQDFIQVMRFNGDMHADLFAAHRNAHPTGALLDRIDVNRLQIRSSTDLEDIFRILSLVTGPSLVDCVTAEDPAPVRARYAYILDILARGIAKAPFPASPVEELPE